MTLRNQKIQKLISSLLVMAIFFPSLIVFFTPQKARAQFIVTDPVAQIQRWVGNISSALSATKDVQGFALQLREVAKAILRETLKAIARKALAEMTKSTVNWINTGFHGAPLFLEHPSSFFGDIVKFKIKDLVYVTGYNSQNYPFARPYLLGVINSYKETLRNNAQYSLSKATSDPAFLRNYRTNFEVGGWGGFMLHTQYPQNNAFGSQLLMNNELARELEAESNKVQNLLQQGQGFLSPQVCLTNPNYDNDKNPYNLPSYQFTYNVPKPTCDPNAYALPLRTSVEIQLCQMEHETWQKDYEKARSAGLAAWNAEHICPGVGLTNTTPGAVVASRIMESLGTTQKQGELSAALGNSLSAIFDALFNKLIGDGLTALSTHINPPEVDNFNYYGATFSGTNDPGWTAGPDQEVILDDFKKLVSGKTVITDPITGAIIQENVGDTSGTPPGGTYVPGAIANTALELRLLDNPAANNQSPGLVQVLDSTWPVAKNLDLCIPGPDKNWEIKLEQERDRFLNGKIMGESSHDDPLKSRAARDIMRELTFAVNAFKDWVYTKMITTQQQGGLGLPSSILFLDAIRELDTNSNQYKDLAEKVREKRTALARLNAIEAALAPITTQPPIGSAQEKNLISIKKQYDAIASSTANAASIDTLQSELDFAKERKQNLLLFEDQCKQERAAANWAPRVPGTTGVLTTTPNLGSTIKIYYWDYMPGGKKVANIEGTITGSENFHFCYMPIYNGYSHGEIIRQEESNNQGGIKFTFANPLSDAGSYGYTDLPLVNAFRVYGDNKDDSNDASGFPVSVNIDCDLLFKTNDTEYKYAGDQIF